MALTCSLGLSLALSGSYWISPSLSLTPTLALTGSHCHSVAHSGSLLLSNFAYTVLDRLSGPLLGSQRRCYADALSPALLDTFDNDNNRKVEYKKVEHKKVKYKKVEGGYGLVRGPRAWSQWYGLEGPVDLSLFRI